MELAVGKCPWKGTLPKAESSSKGDPKTSKMLEKEVGLSEWPETTQGVSVKGGSLRRHSNREPAAAGQAASPCRRWS